MTKDIDRASAGSIVQMLRACDSQMFQEQTGETYQVTGVHQTASILISSEMIS